MKHITLLACVVALSLSIESISQTEPSRAAPMTSRQTPGETRAPYVTTPPEVVAAMLKVAKVTKEDVVYDLGCGDGRIVILAAQKYGARGVGIDLNPERIREANENARQAGVAARVKFLQQDLFESDIKEATVVTLYLMSAVNLKLRPKLWRELKPGTRVVSHAFDMGDWKAEKEVEVSGGRAWGKIYYWVIPEGGVPRD